MGKYNVAKFGTDWSIFANARVLTVKYGKFSNSRADNSDSSGPIRSIIKLIRDLMITYILTKFGADWSIFVECKQRYIQQFFQIQGQITPVILVQFDP